MRDYNIAELRRERPRIGFIRIILSDNICFRHDLLFNNKHFKLSLDILYFSCHVFGNFSDLVVTLFSLLHFLY